MATAADEKRERLIRKLRGELGSVVCAALADSSVVEILLNPDGRLWAERLGEGMKAIGEMSAPNAASLLGTVAASLDTSVTRDRPIVEGELLLEGSRFEGILPPVVSAPTFAIRKRASAVIPLAEYVAGGEMAAWQAEVIEGAVAARRNILVVGGTGSGKTTLVNGILDAVSRRAPAERLAIIEDTAEIQASAPNVVAMRTSLNVGMVELLKATMRLRPDRIIVGEVPADGVVLQKDGSLLAGWYYRGPDLASASVARRTQAVGVVNAALAALGGEWMIHVDAGRVEAAGYPAAAASSFPDAVTTAIDGERRANFEAAGIHYETTQALFVTYLPARSRNRRAVDLVFADGEGSDGPRAGDALLATFEAGIAELEDRLGAILEMERMRGNRFVDEHGAEHTVDVLLSYLRWALTGERAPINLPPCPMYLDAVIGAVELWTGLVPRVGDRYVMCVAIDGFPLETYPGILGELEVLRVSYRWSTRFVFSDAVQAQSELRGYRRRWQQKVRGFWDQILNRAPSTAAPVDADAAEMVAETDAALAEASAGLVGYGAFTSVVVLSDEDRPALEAAARIVRRAILNRGFGARIETINTVEAWLGSLPGHAAPNVRRPMLHTLHLANLIPLASLWAGAVEAPCPMYPAHSPALLYASASGAPFRLNLHVGDVGHTLIFGPTGSGKSTLLALLAAQFRRYPGASVFAFDKGGSLEVLTRAVGGQFFDVTADGADGLCFAPLERLESPLEGAWAADWVETCIELQGMSLTPARRNELARALGAVARQPERTLTALQIEVQDAEMKDALQPYTVTGPHGALLDANGDSLSTGDWACFELGELMALDDRIKLPVLLYLFQVVERRMAGQPCLVILDEAWTMLGHESFVERIRDWLKTMRKANAAVVLATQSLSDATRSGILDVLSESCPTKIYLANAEAEQEEAAEMYRALGLSDAEIGVVRALTPKREYYVRGEGRRVIDLALGPTALAFVAASTLKDRERARALEGEYGRSEWPSKWLEERG